VCFRIVVFLGLLGGEKKFDDRPTYNRLDKQDVTNGQKDTQMDLSY